MEQTTIQLDSIQIVGIKTRTTYQKELHPLTSEIIRCVQRYWSEAVHQLIPHRRNPGILFCVYTEYETDYNGGYTYFIGEEVTQIDILPNELDSLIIPAQTYAKFTTNPGPIPAIIINAWQDIWKRSAAHLGGDRNYQADFEVYDDRARSPGNAVVDIFVGIQSKG